MNCWRQLGQAAWQGGSGRSLAGARPGNGRLMQNMAFTARVNLRVHTPTCRTCGAQAARRQVLGRRRQQRGDWHTAGGCGRELLERRRCGRCGMRAARSQTGAKHM